MKTLTADQWEAAWAEYTQAQERFDAAQPNRFRRGCRREWSNAKHSLIRAKAQLRELDPDFCDRQGI